jgi:hypothetical protein
MLLLVVFDLLPNTFDLATIVVFVCFFGKKVVIFYY